MSYSVNGKIYTDHALMDEIVYNCKLIMKGILLKNQTAADNNETASSILLAQDLKNIVENNYVFTQFPFTHADFIEYGYTSTEASQFIDNPSLVPEEYRADILEIGKRNFINNYVEKNNYYRNLNGLPNYTTDSDEEIERAERIYTYVPNGTVQTAKFAVNQYGYVYIGYKNPQIMANPDLTTELPLAAPIHTWNNYELSILKHLGIFDEILEIYGKQSLFKYLNYMGDDPLDYYEARKAGKWDILRIPSCESLVQDEFKRFFNIERYEYLKKADQLALSYGSDYYDEMIMIEILCQTFADMIVDVPEWYIRRDIFDLRSVQYFLEANDIAFYKQIPLRYQIRIVKNMNKLIRYKSTNQNIKDILEIFSLQGTTVYKYYLIKKFLYNVNGRISDEDIEDESYDFGYDDEDEWSTDLLNLDFFTEENNKFYPEYKDLAVFDFAVWSEVPVDLDDYDFGYEINDSTIPSYDTEVEELDFYNDTVDSFDRTVNLTVYDFGNMDGSSAESVEREEERDNYKESQKTIVDEDGNVYELVFARCPVDENYDNYIRDPFNQYSYEYITEQDKYWDGEDVHNYVKNQHMMLDVNVDATKYMSLDYNISMEEYMYQMEYFLGMIFNSRIDTSNIKIPLPIVNANISYAITDIFMLMYILSYAYNGRTCNIKIPTVSNIEEKPEYSSYKLVDGGFPWSGGEVDPDWKLEDMDFGCEETDVIIWSGDEEDNLDFGFNVVINYRGYYRDYDFSKGYEEEYDFIIDDFGCEETDKFYFPASIGGLLDFGYHCDTGSNVDEFTYDYRIEINNDPEPESDDYGYDDSDTYEYDEEDPILDFGDDDVDEYQAWRREDYDYSIMNADSYSNGNLLLAPSMYISAYNKAYKPKSKKNLMLKPLMASKNAIKQFAKYVTANEEEVEGVILGSTNKWVFGDLYDFLDEDPDYIEPRNNKTYTDPSYDFKFEDRGDVYARYQLRRYDFQPEEETDVWETIDPGVYAEADVCDAGDVSDGHPQDKYRKRIDGGDKEFSVVTIDNFYNWLKTKHPDLWVDKTCKIYGYNFKADLEEIKSNMEIMHSKFGFHDCFGAELNLSKNIITFPKLLTDEGTPISFIKPLNGVIQTYEEMYNIYEINTVCYKVLSKLISNAATRDEQVIYQYLFDTLFITPFDYTLYLDKSGTPYNTYDEVLRDRNFSLYTFYLSIMEENDLEIRKDNIRQILNSIVDTLEYYIKGNNLQYIYSYLPIFDFHSLMKYMMLLLNFFKSL